MSPVTPLQFAGFRIAFGAIQAFVLLRLLPYAVELLGPAGRATRTVYQRSGLPNPLDAVEPTWLAAGVVCALAVLALCIALGVARRAAAVGLWLGWVVLFDRLPALSNPSLPYLGWLCLALAIVPPGEPLRPLSRRPDDPGWRMPRALFAAAWILLAAAYTLSGIDKLQSPSWPAGRAIGLILTSPWGRAGWLRDALLAAPFACSLLTWTSLGIELLFAPLALWRRTRPWIWAAALAMHVGILVLLRLEDLTLGMLAIHLFTFDARWLPARRGAERPIVFYDGLCGLCDRTIAFLDGEDGAGVLAFAPLQGETAGRLLAGRREDAPDWIVYRDEAGLHEGADAVLLILERIGGIWRPLACLARLLPRRAGDALYAWVAANRLRLFGRLDACRIPAPGRAARFLA